ncbi:MAG: DUF1624 domain-containing protein [Oscillospiraceae bacterium]|nr:DUF1624 domain-containing protein [Oscillospiraceae bacterium]
MKLFNDEPVNTGRQRELDWARGFAVIFMILVHVKSELPGFHLSDVYSKIIGFVGSPLAAPTFMILLGAGIVYSRKNEPKKIAIQGIKLLILHYALNIVAFGVPNLIMLIRTQDVSYIEELFKQVFDVDILAFAGLTFLFFALCIKLKLKTIHIVLITLLIACLNYVFTRFISNYWYGTLLGLFVRVNEHSFFPFMAWIGYPVMGYIFGSYLKRCNNKRYLYKNLFAISVLVVIAITLGSQKYGFDIWSMNLGADDYYYQDFVSYILVGGICFTWISLLYFLSEVKALYFAGKQLTRYSNNTTVIYFTQWVIIGWISILSLIDFPVNPWINLLTGIGVIIASDAIAVLYKRLMK